MMSLAANYSAGKIAVDSIEVIRLADAAHKTEVRIVPSIGNIAYQMKVNGKNILWSPFKSLSEMKAKPASCGIPFLAPWANRLDRNAFWANGKQYILNPGLGNLRLDNNQLPIHGALTFSSAWEVRSIAADAQSARVTSQLEFWRYPDLMAQFPFAHTISMTHTLKDGVLEVETVLENHAAEPMPVAVGFHPFFMLHDAPRPEWKAHVAARKHVVLSEKTIPTGELKALGLPDPVLVRGGGLDDVFTDLIKDAGGRAEFWVEGKREKIAVVFGAKYTAAVVFTPPDRDAICFEPMSAITDAFNLAHAGLYKGLQSIPPKGVWRESFWVRPSGF